MKTETHQIIIRQVASPVVEIDTEADAVYVRFKRTKITRTITRPSKAMHIAIDFDEKGEVVGIEAVGASEFTISAILQLARVEAPRLDPAKVRYKSASKHSVAA